jgi:hypothetical protein
MSEKLCQACNAKKLNDDPAIVYLSEHPFEVCDECEKLLMVILQKFEQREKDYESVRLPDDD